MSRLITISQSVDPNTLVLDIHEEHRTRVSMLISRADAEALCDQLRTVLGDSPTAVIPGPGLSVFPKPKDRPMKVRIAHRIASSSGEERGGSK